MILKVPLPPTDNNLRIPIIANGRPKIISSTEYVKWKVKVDKIWLRFVYDLKVNGKRWKLDNPTYEEQLTYKYKLYVDNKCKDIQNFEKALKDFMSKRVYKDDKWVKIDLQLPVEVDPNNPRVEIEIA